MHLGRQEERIIPAWRFIDAAGSDGFGGAQNCWFLA
jgi:hypothetical protein